MRGLLCLFLCLIGGGNGLQRLAQLVAGRRGGDQLHPAAEAAQPTEEGRADHHVRIQSEPAVRLGQDLLSPRYLKTAAYGHFGRREFPWERADQVAALQNAVF